MTSKEKAEELVLKYLRIDNNTSEWFNKHISKQCALIAVDEILKVAFYSPPDCYNFYLNVKIELSNL